MNYSTESRTSRSADSRAKVKRSIVIIAAVLLVMILIGIAGFFGYRVGVEKTQKLYKRYKLVYTDLIAKYSEKYDLDPYLVAAIIDTESDNNPQAVSNMDARGLMQIIPETGEWISEKFEEEFNVEKLFDPETNIRYGCWYLNFIAERMPNVDAVLASYNTGQNRVSSWLEDKSISSDGINLDSIPNKDVVNYLSKVNEAYEIYNKLYPGEFY